MSMIQADMLTLPQETQIDIALELARDEYHRPLDKQTRDNVKNFLARPDTIRWMLIHDCVINPNPGHPNNPITISRAVDLIDPAHAQTQSAQPTAEIAFDAILFATH